MLFSLKTLFYRFTSSLIGMFAKFMSIPKPLTFAGTNSSLQLCNHIFTMGHKKILIITDAALNEIGLLDDTKDKLTSSGIEVSIFDGVEPNPTFDQVHAGVKLAKQNDCDAVIAFGGGSPIDSAKVISLAAASDIEPEKLIGFGKAKKPPLPLYAIPTTAGTGSEVSAVAVISEPASHKKSFVLDPKIVPKAAALDAGLMLNIPAPIIAATGMDALTHAIESYISRAQTKESAEYSIASIKLIFANLRDAVRDSSNIDAQQAMATASNYAGLAFNLSGLGYVHGISHQFSAYYNTPHGLANAIVLPHILEFSKEASETRLAELAHASNLTDATESITIQAQKFIDSVRELSCQINIPTYLDTIQDADIPAIAEAALKESHFTSAVPIYMNQDQCESIIRKIASNPSE